MTDYRDHHWALDLIEVIPLVATISARTLTFTSNRDIPFDVNDMLILAIHHMSPDNLLA